MKISNDSYATTLAYLGARTRMKELQKEKKVIVDQIAWLKDFLKPKKKQYVTKVEKKFKKRKISEAALKSMRANAAKARAAKAAKNGH